MQRTLVHDAATNELRLRLTDLWAGQHELIEYRVLSANGRPVHGRADLDGRRVEYAPHLQSTRPYFIIHDDPWLITGRPEHFATEKCPVRSEKVLCRRFALPSGRAKCSLCR